PSVAQAQGDVTGRIDGVVVDTNGQPLARVTVTATSRTQIGGKRVTQSNDSGEFHLLGLTPGLFRITFQAPGLSDVIRDDIRVNVNSPVSLDVLMEAKGAEETHVIVAERPVVKVRETKVGENFTDKLLRNVPLRVRSYQGAIGLAPGVISPPGTTTTGAGNVYASGGGLMNNTFLVDGVDTTDPATHTVN